jgi:osmotically-inducible protein OsmY
MANRQQNYQSGSSRSGENRSWDDDDSRSARDWDRDYGQYANTDQRGRDRYAGYGTFGQGDYDQSGRGPNTGQDRYGQSDYGQGGNGQGNYGQPNYSYGQPSYGQDYGSSGTSNYGRSSYGSGNRASEGSQGSYGSQGSQGSQGGWREPYGEGQQYGVSGGYSQGQHRGKGPKNFQRSDERVKELLCERLHDDPDIDASEVTVNVQGGKITLEGTVDSRRTKNAIEDVAEQFGSQDVQNNLRVQKTGERSGTETTGKSSTSARSPMSNEDGEQSKQKRN